MSALAPVTIATGTITPCAATMQMAIRLVPSSLLTSASFCPTSGSIAALAKWKSVTHTANTSKGLEDIRTERPEG